jgi:hypothetical protein
MLGFDRLVLPGSPFDLVAGAFQPLLPMAVQVLPLPPPNRRRPAG